MLPTADAALMTMHVAGIAHHVTPGARTVLAQVTQVGADTVIDTDGAESITLTSVLKSSLVAHEFAFG